MLTQVKRIRYREMRTFPHFLWKLFPKSGGPATWTFSRRSSPFTHTLLMYLQRKEAALAPSHPSPALVLLSLSQRAHL